MQIVGVILAGGESRRFGTPKAFAKKEGKHFYTYSAEAVNPFASKLVLVTNRKLEPLFEKEFTGEITRDHPSYEGQGPLAGIYTAMEKYPADWYIVSPIDVPFIENNVIELLIKYTGSDADAVIPVVAGRKQPLIALYHHRVKTIIKTKLDHGFRSVEKVLEACKVHYLSMNDEKKFININSQDDYKQWIMEE
ncbi:molybdenum cofactor guanylyltransferase [Oceanobacillus piezotolerans]|nr:molybdenum cofactor guanylyltransferase [Oceanobacillus piezotolerans]